MNKYDKYYNFRLAKNEDVDNIMLFIKNEWNENHILAHDKELFIWQYGNTEYNDNENINIELMLDKNNNIVGMNGFVKYSRETKDLCVSSAIAKVKEDLEIPMCGVELIKRFKADVNAKAYYSSGTNPKTMAPIGKRIFKYDIGVMKQFYILNKNKEQYKIAHIANVIEKNYINSKYSLKMIERFEDIEDEFDFEKKYNNQGYKSKEFICKRYFKHPIYKYKYWKVINEDNVFGGLLIGREICVNDEKVLRLVDYIGDIEYIGKLGKAFNDLVSDYEYIDMLVGGMDEGIMNDAGFILNTKVSDNIIPTYFEPFVKENIEIWYQRSDSNIVIFKADGDQDRPNKYYE